MTRRSFSVEIAAPPEHVFDLWVDTDRMPEWTEGLTRISDVSGERGQVGTRWVSWFGRSRTTAEVIEADRPRVVAWRVRAGPISATIAATFAATGTGTRLVETIGTTGVVGWVWSAILGTGSYRGSFRGELAVFARICGQDPSPGGASR